jgi:hypothetical protein
MVFASEAAWLLLFTEELSALEAENIGDFLFSST